MIQNRFRYYSKNKKLYFRFTCILSAALLTILFSLFMQIHMFETKKEQNELLYGCWHGAVYNASEASIELINENKMVEEIGSMYVVGDIQNGELFAGSIGYADNNFFKMANLELKDGRFPENENEIAIEKMKLDQMGLDYTLGQKIRIQIIRDDETIDKEFTLTGIINNYSSTWVTKGRLISYFITENLDLKPIETEIFFTVMEHYLETLNDLSLGLIDNLLINTNVEFVYDPLSSQNLPFTLLSIFSIIYSIMLLIYILRQWTHTHSREIQMLKALGANTLMFIRDFTELLAISLLLPLLLFVSISFFLSIPLFLIEIALGIYIISLGSVLIGCTLWITKIPPNINSFTEDTTIIRKTFNVKYKRITPLKLLIRSFRFHWKQELLQMTICCLLLVFLYTALTHTIQNYHALEKIENQPDITVSYPAEDYFQTTYINEKGEELIVTHYYFPEIEKSIVDQFITNNALRSSTTSTIELKYYVQWEDIENSVIFQNTEDLSLQSSLSIDWNQQLRAFLPIYTRYDEAYYEFLSTHIDEGQWDKEAFDQGEVIYIYVPKYTQEIQYDETNLAHYSWDSSPDTFYDEQYIFQENTLKVGDTIEFQAKDQPLKKCKVQGIIRDYYSYDDYSIPNNIYQIFVSGGFYEQANPVNQISLYFETNQNNEILESHFSTLASKNNMIFSNQSQEKRRQREIIRNDLILYSVICIGILFILIFSQVLFISQKRKETSYQFKVFRQLGISSSVFSKMHQKEMIIKIPWILIISFGFFVIIQYLEYLPEKRLMNPFRNRFTDDYWSWSLFIIIEIIFVVIYGLCSYRMYKPNQKGE